MAYQPTPPSVVSTANSSTTPLAASGVFTGTSENITQYSSVTVLVISNVASATDGLSIQQSPDGTNWDNVDNYTIPAATGKSFAVQVTGQFFRVVYTNGATLQTSFRLQTIYHYIATPSSSVRPQDARTNDNDMQEGIAYLAGFNGTTWDRVRTTGTGVLSVGGAVTLTSTTLTSVVPGVAATSLGKAEDAAHTSGDTGVMALGVRNDNAATAMTNANADYASLSVDINGTQFTRDAPSNTATVSTPITAATASTTVLAANPARRSAILYNNSTSDCYLKYGATASSTSFTVYMPSLSTVTITGNEYAGVLNAIWITANGSMYVTETTI